MTAPSSAKANENVKVSVYVENLGAIEGDEVVELYVTILDAKVPVPIHALKDFKRIHLKAGEKIIVEFELKPEALSVINDQNKRVVEPGKFQLFLGGRQPNQKALMSGEVLKAELTVTGDTNVIE
jgi:beta-glucosidase